LYFLILFWDFGLVWFGFKVYNFPGVTGSVQELQDRFLLQRNWLDEMQYENNTIAD